MRYLFIILLPVIPCVLAKAQTTGTTTTPAPGRVVMTATHLQAQERYKKRYQKKEMPPQKMKDSCNPVYKAKFFVSVNYGATCHSKTVETQPDTATFINLTTKKNRLNLGGQYFINEHWAFGVSIGLMVFPKLIQPVEITYERPRRITVTGKGNGGAVLQYGASLQYYFLQRNIRPYVNFSAGNTFIYLKGVKIENSPFTSDKQQENIVKRNAFTICTGGGLLLRIDNHWGLQSGFQYLLSTNFSQPAGSISAYRAMAVSAGVSYIF
jgi:hypothetical protein